MNKKIINITGCFLIAISCVFLARRVVSMNVDWKTLVSPASMLLLVTMPFLNIAVIFFNSYCWGRSLALFTSVPIYNGNVFEVYAKSNLAKYLPGNVGHYAARQMFASRMGLSQLHIALASLFEIGYSSCSMLIISLLFSADAMSGLLRDQFGSNCFVWLGVLAVVTAVVFLITGYIFRRNKYIAEMITLAAQPRFWLTMLRSFGLFTISTLVIGAVFVLIMCQYVSVDFNDAYLLIGGCTASCFIGFVTPGVPGGIGVREAAMLFLLASLFPGDKIMLAAVLQRLTMIIGDALVFPVSHLFWIDS